MRQAPPRWQMAWAFQLVGFKFGDNKKELLVESNMMRVHLRLGDALGNKEPQQRRLRPSMAAYTTQMFAKDTIVNHFD